MRSTFTNLLTCRDLTTCAVGQCKYVLITARRGGIVNDPVLLRAGGGPILARARGFGCAPVREGRGRVRGSGGGHPRRPTSHRCRSRGHGRKTSIRSLFGDAIADLRYYRCAEASVDGIPVVVSRTGWTGEVGYEIYLRDAARGDDLWRRVEEAGEPFGIRAIAPSEARRIEAGIFNYGSDIRPEDTPFHVTRLGALRRARPGTGFHREGGPRAGSPRRASTANSSGS